MKGYDTIIVGAGSAGAVLATRLSEDPDRRVLLIEAGSYYRTIQDFPEEMRQADVLRSTAPDHPASWRFSTQLTPGNAFVLPRGKVVGGSSAINGALFTWPTRRDMEEWARAAGERWGPEAIYPLFARIERDLDFAGDGYHGSNGPIPVGRPRPEALGAIGAAFIQSCKDLGHRYDPDMNSEGSIGVGLLPANAVDGIRQSTAITYLSQTWDRPNLTIVPDTEVGRVLFDGTRAVGVEGVGPEGPVTYRAGEVVLSAGAIKSAQLLMLSGVGPGDELRRHGIAIVQESPGVGTDTTDHCVARVWYRAKGATRIEAHIGAAFQTTLNYASDGVDAANDMALMPSAISINGMLLSETSLLERARMLASSVRALPMKKLVEQVRRGWLHNITVLVMNGENRGRIRLASADSSDVPVIEHHYLEHESDRVKLREGVRLAAAVLSSPRYGEAGVSRVEPLVSESASDAELDRFVREHLGTAYHLSSSCRMGARHDESTVVDPKCRVFGVEGLRVVDTSVVPSPSRRNTNATAMVIGELVAEHMR